MERLVLISVLLLAITVNISQGATLVERTPRIVNGTNAVENQFPYVVSIRIKARNQHSCGGSILSNRWVLTAAHCTWFTHYSNLTVVAGALYRLYGGVPHDLEKVINHNFSWTTLENDISLVKTKNPIVFTQAIQPIALGRDLIGSGVQSVVAGWGVLATGRSLADILQWLPKVTVSNEACKNALGEYVSIFNSTLCATALTPLAGVCNADSGGPLVANNQVIGIASFGIPPCGTIGPDGYVRVSYYYDWIVGNMENN